MPKKSLYPPKAPSKFYLYVSTVLPCYIVFDGSPPRFVLFDGTVPPRHVLFGGTVRPNSFPIIFFNLKIAVLSDFIFQTKQICPSVYI